MNFVDDDVMFQGQKFGHICLEYVLLHFIFAAVWDTISYVIYKQ